MRSKLRNILRERRAIKDSRRLVEPLRVIPSEVDALDRVYTFLYQSEDDRDVYDAVLDELLEDLRLNKTLLRLNKVSRAETEHQLILYAYAVGFEAGKFDEMMYLAGDDVSDTLEDIDFGDEFDDEEDGL